MQVFIADIRNCQNKEQEKTRVDKELGKIRKKFASGNAITGDSLVAIVLNTVTAARMVLMVIALVQSMTGKSMYGSSYTSTCWATKWSSGTSRQQTSFLQQSAAVPPVCAALCYADMLNGGSQWVLWCRYAEKQVGYMACAILLNEVRGSSLACMRMSCFMPTG